MSLSSISQIVLGIITSVGGIGVVTVAVVRFLSDNIADKMSKKYEMQMNKQLEEYKAKLDNGNHISRALFDKEFEAYQILSEEFTIAYGKLETYHGIITSKTNVIIVISQQDTRDREVGAFWLVPRPTFWGMLT